MSIFATLWEGLLNGISNVWSLAIIVIPIIIVLEIAKDNSILDKWSHKLHPPLKHLGLSENAVFPILVAFIFGLTYGSGVIISYVKEGKLSDYEVRAVGSSMALAHALIEDTLLFWRVGIPIWILLLPRLVIAYALVWVLNRIHAGRFLPSSVLAKFTFFNRKRVNL
ncbi:MAG: hypothetical protein GX020_05790 [Firmicutes bacterium]|nr:hypothetical protein [Bacillota bacterium]